MPKFKVGDRISNGKTEYTVLDIETNSNGNLCYRFNNLANRNFLWITSQVDQTFELVEDNDYQDYWNDFRAKAAKDFLCSMISNEGVADERNIDDFTKDNQVKDAVLYADKLILKLKEKKSDDLQNGVVKAIANKYKD